MMPQKSGYRGLRTPEKRRAVQPYPNPFTDYPGYIVRQIRWFQYAGLMPIPHQPFDKEDLLIRLRVCLEVIHL